MKESYYIYTYTNGTFNIWMVKKRRQKFVGKVIYTNANMHGIYIGYECETNYKDNFGKPISIEKIEELKASAL